MKLRALVLVLAVLCLVITVFPQVKVDVEQAVKYRLVQKPWGPRLEKVGTITYIYIPSNLRWAMAEYAFRGDSTFIRVALLKDVLFNKIAKSTEAIHWRDKVLWTDYIFVPGDWYEVYSIPTAVFPKKKPLSSSGCCSSADL